MVFIIISIIIGIISLLSIIAFFTIKEKKNNKLNIIIKKEEAEKQIEITLEKKEEIIDKILEILKEKEIEVAKYVLDNYYKIKGKKSNLFNIHKELIEIDDNINNLIIENEISDNKEILKQLDKLLIINNDLNALIIFYNENNNKNDEMFYVKEKETVEE